MNSSRNDAGHRKGLALALFLASLHLVLAVQVPAQRGEVTKGPAGPLQLRLIVSEPKTCLLDHLTLAVELRNIAERNISVDPRGLLYQMTFASKTAVKGSTHDIFGDRTPEHFVVLRPGESLRKNFAYPLNDPFFEAAGVYSLAIKYGQFSAPSKDDASLYKGSVMSNSVLFELRDCSDGKQ